jgi:hypothetical protein
VSRTDRLQLIAVIAMAAAIHAWIAASRYGRGADRQPAAIGNVIA